MQQISFQDFQLRRLSTKISRNLINVVSTGSGTGQEYRGYPNIHQNPTRAIAKGTPLKSLFFCFQNYNYRKPSCSLKGGKPIFMLILKIGFLLFRFIIEIKMEEKSFINTGEKSL